MATHHLMIDLETLGAGADAAIAEIGLCAFELPDAREARELLAKADGPSPQSTAAWPCGPLGGRAWSLRVDVDDCVRRGLRIETGTVYWWLQQGEAARERLVGGAEPPISLKEALSDLIGIVEALGRLDGVWSHGATFDLPILATAFRACRLAVPWKFWQACDTRTLFWLCEQVTGQKPERPNAGVKHSAADDAVAQARWVQEAHRRLIAARNDNLAVLPAVPA